MPLLPQYRPSLQTATLSQLCWYIGYSILLDIQRPPSPAAQVPAHTLHLHQRLHSPSMVTASAQPCCTFAAEAVPSASGAALADTELQGHGTGTTAQQLSMPCFPELQEGTLIQSAALQ